MGHKGFYDMRLSSHMLAFIIIVEFANIVYLHVFDVRYY